LGVWRAAVIHKTIWQDFTAAAYLMETSYKLKPASGVDQIVAALLSLHHIIGISQRDWIVPAKYLRKYDVNPPRPQIFRFSCIP